MSAICGLLERTGADARVENVASMVDALDDWNADATGTWAGGPAALGHLSLHSVSEAVGESQPAVDPASGVVVACDCRLDYRRELIAEIGNGALVGAPDSTLLLAAYARWGEDCVKHLYGDFAFAIWDPANRRFFCARDPFGVKPLFYADDARRFAFASELKGLFALPGIEPVWVDRRITQFMLGHFAAADETAFDGLRRLPPAHVLMADGDGVRVRRYWELAVAREVRLASDDDYVDALVERFSEAIRVRLRSAGGVACELSGGLDSSGVSAMAQRHLTGMGKNLMTYSHVLSDADRGRVFPKKDERDIVAAFCAFAGIDDPQWIDSRDTPIDDVLAMTARIHDEPCLSMLAVHADVHFERASGRGARVVLSGFGGDQCVSGRGRVVAWSELLAAGRFGAVRDDLRAMREARTVGRKDAFVMLGNSLARAFTPIHPPAGWRYRKSRALTAETSALRPDAPDRAEVLRAIRDRVRAETRICRTTREQERSALFRLHVFDRVEAHTRAALRRHMEMRHPMLDVKLIEFFHALPAEQKIGRGRDRYLYRRALAGLVADEQRWRADKSGAVVPWHFAFILRKRDELRAAIDRARGGRAAAFVDFDRVRAQLDSLVEDNDPRGIFAMQTVMRALIADAAIRRLER